MVTYRDLFYCLMGYLLGSILFAPLYGRLFGGTDIVEESADRNPGTSNAFRYGGFWCGLLTLCSDMAKGFLPVFLYLRGNVQWDGLGLALVIAAPVVGHIFPLYSGLRGGKGIATSFGCLLGLLPHGLPVCILALTFIFFSVVLRVTPHYYRTILTYLCCLVQLLFLEQDSGILLGFGIIVAAVLIRLATSKEQKEQFKVGFLWKY